MKCWMASFYSCWPTKNIRPDFQLGPLSDILTFASLRHGTNRTWNCSKTDFLKNSLSAKYGVTRTILGNLLCSQSLGIPLKLFWMAVSYLKLGNWKNVFCKLFSDILYKTLILIKKSFSRNVKKTCEEQMGGDCCTLQ